MNCPICRKVELEGQQIICSKCKEDSPYNLLSGYSPVKKISDELKKVGLYKKKIRQLTVGLIATGILLVIAILFSIVGIVSSEELGGNENVVEEAGFHTPDPVLPEVNEPIVDSSLSKELAKLKEENSQLKRDIEELGQKYSLEKKEWEQEKMALSTVKTVKPESDKKTIEHIVASGESLSSIALKYYGAGEKYLKIAKDNKMEFPDQLEIGQLLHIYK